MIGGLNTMLNSAEVEVWRKPADSWGESKTTKHHVLEVPVVPRTTSISTNDSFRERIQSGYTMWLDADQIDSIQPDDEFRFKLPTGRLAVYVLDGAAYGLMWDTNPLSSFDMGNEVNIKFSSVEATDGATPDGEVTGG